MDAYPRRRTAWFGALFFLLLTAVAFGFGIGALVHGPNRHDWWILPGLALFPTGAVASIRQLRRPKPLVHLDEDGIEGGFGREAWANVADVTVRRRWGYTIMRRLVLRLRVSEREVAPASRTYASGLVYGRATVYDDRIEIPLWGPKQRVLKDVQRYYEGSVDAS